MLTFGVKRAVIRQNRLCKVLVLEKSFKDCSVVNGSVAHSVV